MSDGGETFSEFENFEELLNDIDFCNIDFEADFNTYRDYDDDEEDEEIMHGIDVFFSIIDRKIKEFESNDLMLDPKRLRDFSRVYAAVKYLVKDDKKAVVKQRMNDPYLSSGCITVISPDIVIKNPRILSKLLNIADTFEVFPLKNGDTQMNFGFNDMVIPINSLSKEEKERKDD